MLIHADIFSAHCLRAIQLLKNRADYFSDRQSKGAPSVLHGPQDLALCLILDIACNYL